MKLKYYAQQPIFFSFREGYLQGYQTVFIVPSVAQVFCSYCLSLEIRIFRVVHQLLSLSDILN